MNVGNGLNPPWTGRELTLAELAAGRREEAAKTQSPSTKARVNFGNATPHGAKCEIRTGSPSV